MSFFKKLFGSKSDTDESPEFKALLEGSLEGLRLQTAAHQNMWRFGQSERWDFTQDSGELIFTFPETTVRAPAQIIGSIDNTNKTWLWAWANPSITTALTQDSVQIRNYGQQNQIKRLTTASWPAEEMDGWQMAALANRLCKSNGVYRGPAGSAFVFFTFGQIQINKRS